MFAGPPSAVSRSNTPGASSTSVSTMPARKASFASTESNPPFDDITAAPASTIGRERASTGNESQSARALSID